MLSLFINNQDRTCDLENNSLKLNLALKRRSNSCKFKMFQGNKPVENQTVRVFDSAIVESISGAVITLKDSYESGFNAFRAGQTVFLGLNQAKETKYTVQSFNESTRQITLTETPSISVVDGDLIGELIFGGLTSRVSDNNVHSLGIVLYDVTCVGFEKMLDSKLVADTWKNVDGRYIINSFLNTTTNFNRTFDNISYANNTAIQAEWTESGDAGNPTVDSSDFLEGSSSGVLSWTNSTGQAVYNIDIDTFDVDDLVGTASGNPTQGFMMLWMKPSNQASIQSITLRVGSDAANYTEVTFNNPTTDDWNYLKADFDKGTTTGTPDWTVIDYAQLTINQTADGTARVNGLRLNGELSFTMFNVASTNTFVEYRAPNIRPSKIINSLADSLEFTWYVDYERDVHLQDRLVQNSFYQINDTSNNFYNLSTEVDSSQLGNRIIVQGGERLSLSKYPQVIEGNSAVREWLMKNKFANLEIFLDNNTSTDTMEVGTNTTTVVATAHGLSTGDFITNRTRNNEVRIISVINANSFTVEAITGQTSGDTFSKFATTQTVGVEGLGDETVFDYMGNSNEKSVRATPQTATLDPGEFLLFRYNERINLEIQYTDTASANALKALGLGDGVIDLDPIRDNNISDTNTALVLAEAKVQEYSNPVISGGFTTNHKGFQVGDIVSVNLADRATVNGQYVIQKISARQRNGQFADHFEYKITFGTTLFGVIEFYQKLLGQADSLGFNVDAIPSNFISAEETVNVNDTNFLAPENLASENEAVNVADSNEVIPYGQPWQWEQSTGQPLPTRWSLFSWG